MNNILLTFVGTMNLLSLLAQRLQNKPLPFGDGFAYYLSDDPAFEGGEGLVYLRNIEKVLIAKKAENLYLSFETWFGEHRKENLCQTRVYAIRPGQWAIGMGDGWTPEVHKNVLKVLDDLGIEYDDSYDTWKKVGLLESIDTTLAMGFETSYHDFHIHAAHLDDNANLVFQNNDIWFVVNYSDKNRHVFVNNGELQNHRLFWNSNHYRDQNFRKYCLELAEYLFE